MPPRPKRRRRQAGLLLAVFLLGIGGISAGAWYLLQRPSSEHVAPYDGRKNVIVFQGAVEEQSFLLENGEISLPFDFIKNRLDPSIYWDEPTKSVIVTTKDKVLQMESDQLVAYLNKTPVNLRVPVKEVDDVRYVPLEPLKKLYPFAMKLLADSGVLLVEKAGYAVQQGKVLAADDDQPQAQPIRSGPSPHQPIVAELPPEALVDVLGEEAGWYRVLSADGVLGYMPKEAVALAQVRQTALKEAAEKPEPAAWKPLGGKINLAWEHVVNRNPNVAEIPQMPGLNVVSPTWFELIDNQGNLGSKADAAYVKWAHNRGYKVWGLVSNGFNPDFTQAMLKDYRLRSKMIAQILHYAHLYDLDGINLDFENVYLEDKERLVQFVRELTPYLHEQGLTVSMDVTVKSNSERWSLFYDRAALARTVDYIAVMTYDEYWASSPVAGSVASLPWTEKGLQGVLEEVPAKKLLLGVPFYTRLWKEVKQPDGTVKVTSKAYSMKGAEDWIRERNLTPQLDAKTGQMFVSYVDPSDGATYKMWLEDQHSMAKRMELVKKYNLAGVAAWRRGFEKEEIWTTIGESLSRKE
ncbi:SH3 domain-containing protein [Brevibacillus sp. SYP-B805]|uniref:glycosyl hydrolase family 18 protein n=1 Tax=Brevibacillus sp. SYP-B805 TaxID=1578199 RepID=UPI0013EAABC4|nr:glycosyl hydrolase family 18 protein [Brevibacillus sp. SYP-B805]NGQ97357.1 SH3 domain-containing protein [Brevibacillus sp. SYP-B805]